MALYAIADLHLSLGCDKPMDVFSGWLNYVERLEKNWKELVKEQDTVVIAGDISWAMKLEEIKQDFAFIHSLPGNKLILKGNHDYWWSTKNKIDHYLEENGFNSIHVIHNNCWEVENIAVCGTRGWLYNAATDEDLKIVNREVGRLRMSLKAAENKGLEPIVFLHYPPVYDGMVCHEILNVLESYQVKMCYFGHIHGVDAAKRAMNGEYHGISLNLISCDYLGFMPVLVR